MKIPVELDVFSLLSLSVSPVGWVRREEEAAEEEKGEVSEEKMVN